MNFSLSTSWNYSKHDSGRAMIDEILSAGFDTVELNFALTRSLVEQILAITKAGDIKVSSLHNMCPLPDEIEQDEASPDYYSLASPDIGERTMAVSAARTTIDYAEKFGACAVILHAGRVPIKDRTRELGSFIADPYRASIIREKIVRERHAKKNGYLDSLILSLSDLIPYALKRGVAIGLENRYYYREIPLPEELEVIFREFPDMTLGYWHDAGHAEVFERLGLVRHEDLLRKFSNRLLGVHLHDIIGPMGDHKAPGCGTLDFRILKPYMKQSTIKVIEVHQPATADELRRGSVFLDSIL